MIHIDLCCGLGGWQEPFRESSEWRSLGIDVRTDLEADVIGDVRELPIRAETDVTLLTMSPPCTEFARWMLPWHDEPNPSLELVNACLQAVEYLNPEYWIMENSRGLSMYWEPAEKKVGSFYLWGSFPPFDVGDSCMGKTHISGSKPEERAKIPYALSYSLMKAVEWSI